MMKIPMSSAATALLRALIDRANIPRNRILLRRWRSVDWQSLTFVGERHEIELHITGSDSAVAADRLIRGLSEAQFDIPRQILADIAVVKGPARQADGSTSLNIEALTIADELA